VTKLDLIFLHNNASKAIHSLLNIFLNRKPIRSTLSILINFFRSENTMITIRISNNLTNLFSIRTVNEVNLNQLFQGIKVLGQGFVLESADVGVIVVGIAASG
jgi:hypothetical protein